MKTLQTSVQSAGGHREDSATTRPARWAVDSSLPMPPTTAEKYFYYGRQHLWFIWMRTFATISASVSLILFSVSSTPLWLFWIPFSIFVMYMVLTHFCTTRKRQFSLVDHKRIVELWAPEVIPSVDVFLPSAGEDLEVLENTYIHVARLEYAGKVKVYVLDDGDRREVEELAAQFGYHYLVRPNRPHMKKAGNLKHGFENSSGDLIVIFDADFCPRPDFINELAPYFDDPEVGIVQSPQFFDSHGAMHWLQRSAGAVQESFYRWAQVSRDKLGAPICVGTCAIYRRAGLNESGGFAQIGHSEDVHTGVKLLKVGFKTLYIPVILAKGLCPDQLSGFLNQQYRWCAGSMSLLADRAFHAAPLNLKQRLCFFSGFLYYISTAVFVFTVALPSLTMLWLFPEKIELSNYRLLLPALFVTYALTPLIMRCRWRPEVLRVQMIYS